jgi:hypothetical protein
VALWFNNVKMGVFNVTSRIVASGGAGNDRISPTMRGPAVQLSGEAGNDTLRGGKSQRQPRTAATATT